MKWFWEQYVGDDVPASDPYLSPGRAMRLASLPPTHVITAEFDVLRDEGEAYAARMAKAGNEMTLRRYDGVIHGFFHLRALFDDAHTALSDIATVIKQRLDRLREPKVTAVIQVLPRPVLSRQASLDQ